MKKQINFQKEWEKTKSQLMKFSEQAVILAKKGEKEVVKLSRRGKLHIDSSAATLKKDRLFFLIGREYVKSKCPGEHSAAMKKHLAELHKINAELRNIKINLKKNP
jgi:hypothetical protein